MIKKISKYDLEKVEYYKENGFIDAAVEIPCGCNFHCKYCYRDGIIPHLSYEKIINVFEKLKDMGVINIYLTGGEVFTYNHFIKLYLYLKNNGFIVYILSNGSKIYHYNDILKKYPPADIFITLYGTNENEYTEFVGVPNQFREVIKSLTFLTENNIPFSLNTHVTKINFDNVMAGKYDEIGTSYQKKINYNYMLIPTLTGDIYPLNYQLEEKYVIKFLNKYNSKNKKYNRSDFLCKSGIYSIMVNNCEYFTVCLKDRNNKFSTEMACSDLIASIKERATKIKKEANLLNCAVCDINSDCEWCPVQFEFNRRHNEYICKLKQRIAQDYIERKK